MNKIVEICAGSYQDCLAAAEAGATRVELNSALSLGGLTPSLGTLLHVKRDTDLTVICMVRPRAAGFCYDAADVQIMMEDAKLFLENGADGIAFGFLNSYCTIQEAQTTAMCDLIHSFGKCAVFHRAFDLTPNPDTAMETLIHCGVDRVLTSGQKKTACDGLNLIKHLQTVYGSQIEILPGSGIRPDNAKQVLHETGVSQIHSSCKSYQADPTTRNNQVDFSYLDAPHESDYTFVDADLVRQLLI